MQQVGTDPTLRPPAAKWLCIWCYAWAYASADGQDVLRPMYSPTYGRWERAEGGGLDDDKSHGYLPIDTEWPSF